MIGQFSVHRASCFEGDPRLTVRFLKEAVTRSAGWDCVRLYGLALGVREHAWRKAHSEHVWCWYVAHEGPVLPIGRTIAPIGSDVNRTTSTP